MLEIKGAMNTAAVAMIVPHINTSLWPNFSHIDPPRKLPITQPTVFNDSIMLMVELLVLNSSIKKGMKLPLELSKSAIMKYI